MHMLPRFPVLLALLYGITTGSAWAEGFVSVSSDHAILYDLPSTASKKLFVVNRYTPFEQIVTLESWVKVRDHSGGVYWMEKHDLSSKRYVYTLPPLVNVHAAPDAGSARVFQVRQQVALEYIDATAGWIRVRHQDGNIGYVRSSEVWGG